MTNHKLPAEAYTSPVWFDTERDCIFGRSWLLVASTDELPCPGDYRTLDVGATPAVLLRGADGVPHAFHNLCPHRAMTLLDGAGNTKTAITCPYHCWRFGLDGTLKVVPQQDDEFPDMQRGTHDLQPLHLDTWENFVFVSADTDPPPLSEWIDGLDVPDLHRPVGLTLRRSRQRDTQVRRPSRQPKLLQQRGHRRRSSDDASVLRCRKDLIDGHSVRRDRRHTLGCGSVDELGSLRRAQKAHVAQLRGVGA